MSNALKKIDMVQPEEAISDSEQTSDDRGQLVEINLPVVTLTEPDASIIARQVADTVPKSLGEDFAIQRRHMHGSVALYAQIEPQDGVESILARTMVGLSNCVMDCLSRASDTGDSSGARDVNLRHAIKGTSVISELVKTLDNHRRLQPQSVKVGQVDVQSGGQAIVGNVGAPETRKTPDPSPLCITASGANGGDGDDDE